MENKTMISEVDTCVRLGKEVKISPKANTQVNKPGMKIEYHVETVSVPMGIGNDHTAMLIMDKAAWEALNKGAEVTVTTTKEISKIHKQNGRRRKKK